MKAKKEKLRENSVITNSKLIEKQKKLIELDKLHDKQREEILKKLEKMQMKKEELDKKKDEIFKKIKNIRDKYYQKAQINKSLISEREEIRRENILSEEGEKIDRARDKERRCESMNASSRYRTAKTQKDYNDEIQSYLKARNNLQNESILKLTEKQKKQIYLNKLKKEAEERKKEREKDEYK